MVVTFDGDEMNLHAPQSQGARVECSTFDRTIFHIVSAQNNAPIMGCVQNTLVCMYYITETFMTPEEVTPDQPANFEFPDGTPGYQTMLRREDFFDACTQANIGPTRVAEFMTRVVKYYPEYVTTFDDGHLRLTDLIPGKLVASIIFPSTFCWSRKTDTNEKLPIVTIKDGIILPTSGPLCKKSIGGTSGSVIHPIWKGIPTDDPTEGPTMAANMISEFQFMSYTLITRIGFSMGISDCLPIDEDIVKRVLVEAMLRCELVNNSNKDPIDKEVEINSILNEAMSVAPKLAKTGMNKRDRNALVVMKKCGAKGSDTNNGQIAGLVGQQNIDGKMMPFTISGGTRTLHHYFFGSLSPESRGFVSNSYLKGLNFKEQWFHATGGRRGVVDTALKSVTGETEIIIEENGEIKKYKIGEWIDDIIKHDLNVEKYTDRHMELSKLGDNHKVFIPTCDEHGWVSWGDVVAVTRHDPGDTLFKITTVVGSSVIVTGSKSMLIWDATQEKYIQTLGSEVKCGDFMPSSIVFPVSPAGLTDIFPLPNWGLKIFSDYPKDGKALQTMIVSIEPIEISLHEWVYDLTVPSTTNFCLANGLHVVDTSDSGYLQKKIVAAISDFKAHHDGSVRNANGAIIEFAYGGDTFNAKELMMTKGIDYPFFINLHLTADCFNSEVEQSTPSDSDYGEKRKLTTSEVNLLVSFIQAGIPATQTEVIKRITYNIKTVLRVVVAEVMLYEAAIPKFFRRVRDEFERAKVENGYMAGLVASCSIGEPTTQLTLNSVDWNTPIYIRIDKPDKTIIRSNDVICSWKGIVLDPIGKIIDTIIDAVSSATVQHFDNETELVDVTLLNMSVPSVDDSGNMHWKKLEAVTRHPPGSGGKLVWVRTASGREVKVTKSKSLLVIKDDKVVPILGSEIKVGDLVPVVAQAPIVENSINVLDITKYVSKYKGYFAETQSIKLDNALGFVFGCYLAHGYWNPNGRVAIYPRDSLSINKISEWCHTQNIVYEKLNKSSVCEEHITIYSWLPHLLHSECGDLLPRTIPKFALIANLDFVKGLLDGYFNNARFKQQDNFIIYYAHSENLLTGIAELCSRLGIYCQLEEDKNFIMDRYTIKISIHSGMWYHCNDVMGDPVVSVTEVDSSHPKVYDLTVADTRNFTVFGGLCVRDTFHNAGNSAKDVTLGVPRFQEILNASGRVAKSGKIIKGGCIIYLKNGTILDNATERARLQALIKTKEKELVATPKTGKGKPAAVIETAIASAKKQVEDIDHDSLEVVTQIAAPLAKKFVSDIMVGYELQYLPTEKGKKRKASPLGLITYEQYEPKWWVTLQENLGTPPTFPAEAWVIILTLDTYKLYSLGITTEDVAIAIEENSFGSRGRALACVASPNNIGQLEIYLNFTEIGEHTREQVDMPLGEKISRYLITPENLEYFAMREVALDLIKKTQLQGVTGITKTYVRQAPLTGEWLIDTQGTNLRTILGLKDIDATRTISDSMWEIYHTLGIEATRRFLVREITKILSFDGTYINPRHICLLVDGMLRMGTINSVNRDGIPRDVGPIAKGMFEKAVDNFAEAAAFGEHDEMHGVAASVMFGTLPEVGTGVVEIKDAETLPVVKKRPPVTIPLHPRKK